LPDQSPKGRNELCIIHARIDEVLTCWILCGQRAALHVGDALGAVLHLIVYVLLGGVHMQGAPGDMNLSKLVLQAASVATSNSLCGTDAAMLGC
jgi:hypothetical protein